MKTPFSSFFFFQNSVKSVVKDLKLKYLMFNWDDSPGFLIPIDDIVKGLSFIDNGRKIGNVLVHCAQVQCMNKYCCFGAMD